MDFTIFNSTVTDGNNISKDEWRVWQEEKSKLLQSHNDEKISLINEITELRTAIIQAKKMNSKGENIAKSTEKTILLQKSFDYLQNENIAKNTEIIELNKLVKSKDELYSQLDNKNLELEKKILSMEEEIIDLKNYENNHKISIKNEENYNFDHIKNVEALVENISNEKDNEMRIAHKYSAYENKILEVINSNNDGYKLRVKELEIENKDFITMLKDAEIALLKMEDQVKDMTQEKESIEHILFQLVNSTEEMKKEFECKNNQFEQEKILAEKNYRRIRKKYQDSNDIIAGLKAKLELDDSLPSWVNVISKQLYDINDNELSPLKSLISKPNTNINTDIINHESPIKIVGNVDNLMKNDKIDSNGSYLKSMGLINGINRPNISDSSNINSSSNNSIDNNNYPRNELTFKSTEHMLRQAFRSTNNNKSSSSQNNSSLSPKRNNLCGVNDKQPNFLTHTGSSSNYIKEVNRESKPLNISKGFKFQ
jgi:hypothetical protein